MPTGYTSLPNPSSHVEEDELEAAFEASDDEDEHAHESSPLTHQRHSSEEYIPSAEPLSITTGRPTHSRTSTLGAYDFEADRYDFPPPGSPPRRDRAFTNDWGNSNGIIPAGPVAQPHFNRGRPGMEWMRRVLPARIADRIVPARQAVAIGGGGVDGVFSNMSAKPTLPRLIREEDSIYVQPEDAQKDAPPSYAAAQADAVPPYWETTVHAPSSLSPGLMVAGEVLIENLATGTVFSFLWNMLVSISFQFVGFLLTYLLHTSHAAKLGARAGLGLTLVQYGFALKTGRDEAGTETTTTWAETGTDGAAQPLPSFGTAAEADAWFSTHPNVTLGSLLNDNDGAGEVSFINSDLTTEWLAFLLMTIGWFILLNSLLGFWRIKRWERSILESHRENPAAPIPMPGSTSEAEGRSTLSSHFERTFGLRLPSARNLQLGLGLRNTRPGSNDLIFEYDENLMHEGLRHDSVEEDRLASLEDEVAHSIPEDHPERERLIAEVIAGERRLQNDLRAAGLL